MQQPNIKEFAHKWMEGTITEEEKAYFERWYNSFDFSSLELSDHWAEVPEDIRQKIHHGLQRSMAERQPRVLRPFVRWAAAAVLLIACAGAIYLWQGRREKVVPMAAAVPAIPAGEVLPGGNRAVLTLADGTQITLDSARNGILAQQGAVQVVKADSGQLVYNGTAAASGGLLNYNTLATPRGGQYQVTLPDGTKAWLNAASSLKYPIAFTGRERVVELNGEGYFEVAQRADQPFIVKTNDALLVQALGTGFNVMAYTEEAAVSTTLLEGAVLVRAGSQRKVLQPGRQASWSRKSGQLIEQAANIQQAVAWKNGYFQFDHADIQTVMRQVARWYDVTIAFEGNPSGDEFAGRIPRSASLASLLRILELSNIHFRVEGRKIVVTP